MNYYSDSHVGNRILSVNYQIEGLLQKLRETGKFLFPLQIKYLNVCQF